MPIAIELSELYRPVEKELQAVRKEVSAFWQTVLQLVNGPEHVPQQVGGKLLRPALCLLSAGAVGQRNLGPYVAMATAMELFHLAALAHDDVIDGAQMRRGNASLNAMWNDHAAVLGGDYLVARGIGTIAAYGSCDAVVHAVDCIRVMAEGELVDYGRGANGFSRENCLALARAKTASLFGVACSTPAVLTRSELAPRFYDYGISLGTAFQIVDDLLDVMQDEEALGKPAFGDVAKGKKTIPLLFLRDGLDSAGAARLDAMRNGAVSRDDRAWVTRMLEETGALQRAESLARSFSDEARAALADIEPSPYKDALLGLAEFVLIRGN